MITDSKTYQDALKELNEKHKKEKDALIRAFALEQNPHKQGDVISDHRCTIRITKIWTLCEHDKPTCVYDGIELKKDLTPKHKKGNTEPIIERIWQSGIKK